LYGEALNGSGAFMQEFFDDVEIVKENIVAIRNATTRVGEINQQVSDCSLEDISCCVMRIQILNPFNLSNMEGGLSHD
jgi:hypothetical protein